MFQPCSCFICGREYWWGLCFSLYSSQYHRYYLHLGQRGLQEEHRHVWALPGHHRLRTVADWGGSGLTYCWKLGRPYCTLLDFGFLVETGYTTQSRVLSSSHGCWMSEVGLFPKCWKHVGPLSVPSGGSFCLPGWYSLLRRCSMSVLDCVRLRVYGLEIMYNFPYWVYGLRKNTNLRLMKWMPRFLFSCLHYAMDINQLARVSVADGRQERTIQWTLTHALHKRIVITRP